MSFEQLGLRAELQQQLKSLNYQQATEIQQQSIPAILAGDDVLACAKTGSGKTAGFVLPIIEQLLDKPRAKANQAQALILAPTRELAIQIDKSIIAYKGKTSLSSLAVVGGVKINPQMLALTKGVDILVATPGRLLDLAQQNAVKFDQLSTVVLDEADRMLDMGFVNEVKKIINLLPKKRQNLLFSATFNDEVKNLGKKLLTNNIVEVAATVENHTAPDISQRLISVDQSKKSALLLQLLKQNQWSQVLVFIRSKHAANRLSKKLQGKKFNAAAIHGDKSQNQRTKALTDFKSGKLKILVATDIAARGLDIKQLPVVINFDLPQVAQDYVHRIGRTGRAGASGEAISLVDAGEFINLRDVEQLIQQHIERSIVEEFEPATALPNSKTIKPPKKKKPKKNKKPSNNQPAK